MTRTMGAAGVMAVVVVMAALARVVAQPSLPQNEYFLKEHNKARLAVGVPALKWSYGLQLKAEAYVDKVGCTVTSPGYSGVNLYLTADIIGFAEVMPKWLYEKKYYIYSTNSCVKYCRHYTQIVWKTTLYVGCAYHKCGNGGIFVVCYYSPPGNIPGQRPY